MKTKLIIAAFLLAGLFSCEKQKLNKLEIRMGMVTSDCIPSDSLVLTNETLVYKMTTNCSTSEYNANEAISSEDWDEILQLFDWDKFKKIKNKAGDVAVDGAYNYIEVLYGTRVHRVHYISTDDEDMATISLLAEKLEVMKAGHYAVGLISLIFN